MTGEVVKLKVRCEYCWQPNYANDLHCRFCGAPLPDRLMKQQMPEGTVEKAYYAGVAVTAMRVGALQFSMAPVNVQWYAPRVLADGG